MEVKKHNQENRIQGRFSIFEHKCTLSFEKYDKGHFIFLI